MQSRLWPPTFCSAETRPLVAANSPPIPEKSPGRPVEIGVEAKPSGAQEKTRIFASYRESIISNPVIDGTAGPPCVGRSIAVRYLERAHDVDTEPLHNDALRLADAVAGQQGGVQLLFLLSQDATRRLRDPHSGQTRLGQATPVPNAIACRSVPPVQPRAGGPSRRVRAVVLPVTRTDGRLTAPRFRIGTNSSTGSSPECR